jgi:hypothetical protein
MHYLLSLCTLAEKNKQKHTHTFTQINLSTVFVLCMQDTNKNLRQDQTPRISKHAVILQVEQIDKIK